MQLTRIHQRAHELPVIEVADEFLFVSTLLVHIERLPGVRVLAKRSWFLSDTFDAVLELDGHRFLMSLLFGCVRIQPCRSATPRESIDRLARHIDDYRTVWPITLLWALGRYFMLPYKAPGE